MEPRWSSLWTRRRRSENVIITHSWWKAEQMHQWYIPWNCYGRNLALAINVTSVPFRFQQTRHARNSTLYVNGVSLISTFSSLSRKYFVLCRNPEIKPASPGAVRGAIFSKCFYCIPLDPPTFRLGHQIVRLSRVTHSPFSQALRSTWWPWGCSWTRWGPPLRRCIPPARHASEGTSAKVSPVPHANSDSALSKKDSGDPRLVTKNTPLHNLRRPASCLWRTHALSFSSQLLLSKHIIRV